LKEKGGKREKAERILDCKEKGGRILFHLILYSYPSKKEGKKKKEKSSVVLEGREKGKGRNLIPIFPSSLKSHDAFEEREKGGGGQEGKRK